MTTTTNEPKVIPLKDASTNVTQVFADVFAAFRLLAAADKIERAEQTRALRRF